MFNIFRSILRIMPKIKEPNTTTVKVNASERPDNDDIMRAHHEDDQRRKPMFLFSVDYILNKAGETNSHDDTDKQNSQHFDWLYCTRFKPPKLDSKLIAYK